MTDDSSNSNPKIVNFGIAKMQGSSKTINEYIGSTVCTAPEVL
jgi:hypothetical protein